MIGLEYNPLDGSITLLAKPGEVIFPAVNQLIHAQGWQVRELEVERGRLDEVFRSFYPWRCSMKQLPIIFKREFASFFATPLAYVFLLIFLVLSSVFTFYLGGFYQSGQANLNPFF